MYPDDPTWEKRLVILRAPRDRRPNPTKNRQPEPKWRPATVSDLSFRDWFEITQRVFREPENLEFFHLGRTGKYKISLREKGDHDLLKEEEPVHPIVIHRVIKTHRYKFKHRMTKRQHDKRKLYNRVYIHNTDELNAFNETNKTNPEEARAKYIEHLNQSGDFRAETSEPT